MGLSASGTTPYVLGALRLARRNGARTIAITSNRNSPIARAVQIAISPDTGAEVIAGSTRMKAGTAQKLILNMLSTAAMVRLGHVYNNWMIDVALSTTNCVPAACAFCRKPAGRTHGMRPGRCGWPRTICAWH